MHTFTRREFLRVSTLATAATLAAGCVAPATPAAPTAAPVVPGAPVAPTTAAPAQPVSKFQEAPMLAELVAQGQLPPVDERLPENPGVSPVLHAIGRYGGTIRRGFSGMSDRQGPRQMRERGFIWYNVDFTMRPALAESWEVNEDGSRWTWHLRKGTKWSDGEPFTTQDVAWFWEHRLKNTVLSPKPTSAFHGAFATGDPAVLGDLETPDDWTLIIHFAHPKPMFAYTQGWEDLPFTPAHYMQQFHVDFVPQADLETLGKAEGLDTWDKLYADREREDLTPGKPTLSIWKPMNTLSEELFVMERNPYFWAVDADGQQLPYVDRVTHRLYGANDVFNMWLINGEIDFQARGLNIANITLLKENEANGDYQIMQGTKESHIGLQCNQASKDARLSEFFGDRQVRIALSHAVNREEMNELVYDGLAVPRQYSPLERTPQYHDKLSNAYLEYDPAKANELLDQAGYSERNAEGFRLFKDGSEDVLAFIIEGLDEAGSPTEDAAQLAVRYFQEVGIHATYKYIERSLYQERCDANDIACGWWGGDRTELPMIDAGIFIGIQPQRMWSGAWGLWKRSGGTDPNGEEPPEGHWIWDIWDAYAQVVVEPDFQKRIDLFAKILDIWAEELPQPTYLGQFPGLVIVKNGFQNFEGGYPIARTRCDEHIFGVETYYWDEPENHA